MFTLMIFGRNFLHPRIYNLEKNVAVHLISKFEEEGRRVASQKSTGFIQFNWLR